jgi:signal transduction histidine kinase
MRVIAQCSIAILVLTLITIAFSRLHVNLTTVSLLYVIVIVLLARVGDLVTSVVVSVIAAMLLAYVAPPTYSFRINDPLDFVAVAAFLITSLIITRLVSRLHETADQALSSVNRSLLQAEQKERTRIGRELHDDINQRLALLAVELGQMQNDPSDVQSHTEGLRRKVTDISNDVQALSHELHSSKLEYLGVVSGIRSWCKEFAERHGMEINFKTNVTSPMSPEMGLVLLRIVQEALHNTTKHSGVKRADVQLSEYTGEIHLTISDSGKGFDIEAARQGRGLGLTSMQERVRLVNGTVEIRSKPMGGTVIRIRVPLDTTTESTRAAG